MNQPNCIKTFCERAALMMLRSAKPAPPIARSGRIVLTLLFMLLTTASAWADNHVAGRVIINQPTNGTITVMQGNTPVNSGDVLSAGTKITINSTPDDGYKLLNGTIEEYNYIEPFDIWHQSYQQSFQQTPFYYTITANQEIVINAVFDEDTGVTTYALTSQISGSGTMTFSVGTQQNVISAEEGAQVDITMSAPGNGKYWELSSQHVSITQDDATHFHFTMPATAVTVSALLKVTSQTRYQIFDNSTNGHVAVSGGDTNGFFEDGGTATLTPTPDTGYEYVANSLTATNQDTSASIGLTDNGNGTWSFQMPANNVIVSATFTPIDPGNDPNGTYIVHFDANNAYASGTMNDQTFTVGVAQALTANTFTTNYVLETFAGWNTKADGSGTNYADGATVTDLAAAGQTVTLYAQWQDLTHDPSSLSNFVHFDANGGTGTMADQTYSIEWANLSANTFTRDGYTFTGWNTAADGSGTTYSDQQNIHPSSDMTLYAQWSLNTSTHYAVHFNANGGTGKMFDQAIAAGASADLTANAFTREGYTFTGWSTQANGTIVYLDGENVSHLALAGQTANLYAQWNKGAMTIAKEQGEIVVTLDGDSDEPFEITSDIIVDKVILRRKFVQGVPTTICLPFDFSRSNFDHEDFSTLNYVDENQETHQLVAHMTVVKELQANTPYYFEPSESTATQEGNSYTEIVFNNVAIVAGNAGSSTTGGWTIVGNYDRVKWTTNTADPLYSSTHAAELGRAYGYAKKTKTVGGVTYQEGQFVKLGYGAHTRAFRAYMLAPATNNSPGLNDLPDTIDVVWHNDNATSITSMSDGRSQMSDVWYDLSGRKLNGKPTAKGVYVNNGRKVVVK